jgi:hypothetical protein
MKKFILSICVLFITASSAHADIYRTINTFTVVRDGGGQAQILVSARPTQNGTSEIVGTLVSCNFKTLKADQQLILTLTKETADKAAKILGGSALIAQKTILKPILPTGSFPALQIDYSYKDFKGNVLTDSVRIPSPVVIIDGQASSVLTDIENEVRGVAASMKVCD